MTQSDRERPHPGSGKGVINGIFSIAPVVTPGTQQGGLYTLRCHSYVRLNFCNPDCNPTAINWDRVSKLGITEKVF